MLVEVEAAFVLQGAQMALKELIVVVNANPDHTAVQDGRGAGQARESDEELIHLRHAADRA
jgi:hypothetical protein